MIKAINKDGQIQSFTLIEWEKIKRIQGKNETWKLIEDVKVIPTTSQKVIDNANNEVSTKKSKK